MYAKILMTLDATATDRAIVEHIKKLAGLMKSRVTLLHVATGVQAQWHGENAAGEEVREDRNYLEALKTEFQNAGIEAEAELLFGDPVTEIVQWNQQHPVDLIAMSTHGHQFVADVLLGTTANRVQHQVSTPVLMLRAK